MDERNKAPEQCPYCDGSGAISHTVMVCCGYPNQDGSCCGNGRPDIELEQCQWCDEHKGEPMDDATRYALGAM